MRINNFFSTPIWSEEKPEFVKSLNKASDKYIRESKKMPDSKKHLKQYGDFGRSWHSTPLLQDNDFIDLRNYIGQKSWEFLDHHGYDMKQYQTMFSEMWVQEFSKKGGGHHSAHIHWNQHVSGFYFLTSGIFLAALIYLSLAFFNDLTNSGFSSVQIGVLKYSCIYII